VFFIPSSTEKTHKIYMIEELKDFSETMYSYPLQKRLESVNKSGGGGVWGMFWKEEMERKRCLWQTNLDQ
jgi:hypothetical protein